MKKHRKNNRKLGCMIIVVAIVLIAFTVTKCVKKDTGPPDLPSDYTSDDAEILLRDFAKKHGLEENEWPDSLIELLDKNPETKEFVLNYPLEKDKKFRIDLSEYKNSEAVPLFMQWDMRWGYNQYAGDLMGLTGCGPTCLSMVAVYLLNDDKYNPEFVAEFAIKEGYSVSGNGSAWSLISEGGKKLGLNVREIPLDENVIINNLRKGYPIICIMGPGDFTASGHFIVMTELVGDKIKINDPNSKYRSEKLWDLPDIKNQINNLWVCKK